MNKRTLFSITAACALSIAVIAGASAAAIAAATPMPRDGGNQVSLHPASNSLTASEPSPAPNAHVKFPAVGGDVARPLEPGDVLVTEKQIRSVLYKINAQVRAAEPGNPPADQHNLDAAVTESVMDVKCMAAAGFYYNPIAIPGQLTGPLDPAAAVALWGSTGGGDAYRWQDAGCHGKSVHDTGNDNAN